LFYVPGYIYIYTLEESFPLDKLSNHRMLSNLLTLPAGSISKGTEKHDGVLIIQDPRSRILDPGSWIQDPRSRILDPGSYILDPTSWIQIIDPGS